MTFDIIDISEEEVKVLEVIQLKMLRTAQQKKNELYHKLQSNLNEYKKILYSNGIFDSTLYRTFADEQTAEFEYQVEILREQLLFNMSLREPTNNGETGNGNNSGDENGYIVDYELSYLERYIAVRDYYLTIRDYDERIALYQKDKVAMEYLGKTYYNALFDYFVTHKDE